MHVLYADSPSRCRQVRRNAPVAHGYALAGSSQESILNSMLSTANNPAMLHAGGSQREAMMLQHMELRQRLLEEQWQGDGSAEWCLLQARSRILPPVPPSPSRSAAPPTTLPGHSLSQRQGGLAGLATSGFELSAPLSTQSSLLPSHHLRALLLLQQQQQQQREQGGGG
jgi:hypothetical protein